MTPTATDTPTVTPTGATPTATTPPGGEPLEDPIPEPIPLGDITIRLIPLIDGLVAPNWGVPAPGICQQKLPRMFITDQVGIVWALHLRSRERTVFLDVSDRLVPLGAFGPGTFDERGLLGIAFHPDYSENGLLYTYTSEPVSGEADFSTMPPGTAPNHQSVVREWQVPDPCNRASVVDPGSSRELLRIDEPQFNHNGGALNFGPDGMLYIALGDGGQADDQGVGHSPQGNGQDTTNPLGDILRLDPQGSNSANGQYGIPDDNPFVGQSGYVPEIYASGFRNPFRFSFDPATGEMWIGDVGQNDIEEVDKGVSGGNFGWNLKEGSFCFNPNGTEPGFVTDCAPGQVPDDLIDPVAEFDHDEGIAVIGGFVYHGKLVPALRGKYVFGDFDRPTPGRDGRLFYLDEDGQIFEFRLDRRETLGLALLGFGVDSVGNVYVLANATGTPFGETGVIFKISRPMRKAVRSPR
jgi:hypothetical protein